MRPFFDTNVLVYAYDEGEPEKRQVADRLIEEHLVGGEGMVSVQVLREFYAAARRLARPVSDDKAQEAVRHFAAFVPEPEDTGMVLGAVRRSQEISISFWDALIVEAALRGGADTLFSEDLQHGQVIEGMRIENPFL